MAGQEVIQDFKDIFQGLLQSLTDPIVAQHISDLEEFNEEYPDDDYKEEDIPEPENPYAVDLYYNIVWTLLQKMKILGTNGLDLNFMLTQIDEILHKMDNNTDGYGLNTFMEAYPDEAVAKFNGWRLLLFSMRNYIAPDDPYIHPVHQDGGRRRRSRRGRSRKCSRRSRKGSRRSRKRRSTKKNSY
jgi:hypothetical protein